MVVSKFCTRCEPGEKCPQALSLWCLPFTPTVLSKGDRVPHFSSQGPPYQSADCWPSGEHVIGDTHASSVPAATPGLDRPLELSVLSPTPLPAHLGGGLAGAGQCGRVSRYWHLQSGVKERGIPCGTEAGGEAGRSRLLPCAGMT